MEKTNKKIKSNAIRSTRMRLSMKSVYNKYYNKYCIRYSDKKIAFKYIFVQNRIIVEIGFGMADTTIEITTKNNDIDYIAIDVHKPGIAKF